MARELNPGVAREADIVDLAHDGRGVARVDGKAVFIAGALPGERVSFHTVRRRRQMDEAALAEVLIASPDRVEPKCAHFGVCGGCTLQHLAAPAQLAAKQRQLLETLERIGRVRPERVLEPVQGPHWAYRRRARLGVKYVHKKGRVLAGFREREKPYLADIQRCEILIDRFAELPKNLAALVEGLSIREKMPQVELAAGDGAAALVFRVLEAPTPEDLRKLAQFGIEVGAQVYLQSGGLDSVRPLQGEPMPLRYAAGGGVQIEFGPSDFIQVNAEINLAMVALAIDELQPGPSDSVLDLFCGLGNFTLPLARRACWEWRATRPWWPRRPRMPPATAWETRPFSATICSNRPSSAHGQRSATTWCCSTRRAPGPAKSWNVCHIGTRAGSCIFHAIQGAWRGMRGF